MFSSAPSYPHALNVFTWSYVKNFDNVLDLLLSKSIILDAVFLNLVWQKTTQSLLQSLDWMSDSVKMLLLPNHSGRCSVRVVAEYQRSRVTALTSMLSITRIQLERMQCVKPPLAIQYFRLVLTYALHLLDQYNACTLYERGRCYLRCTILWHIT